MKEDRLPRISIKLDTTPREFLKRFEEVVLQIDNITARRVASDDSEGYEYLTLRLHLAPPHRGLIGQIIIAPDTTKAIIEVRATKWVPDPPTYDVYAESARAIFEPLLRQYNKRFASRRRLSIQAKSDTEPKLPAKAQKIFDHFVILANKSGLHPYDWQRFYDFIWHCASHNLELTPRDIQELLIAAEFSEEYAEYIADIFIHGVGVAKAKW